MPHSALKLLPGVDTTKTPTLNEAALSQSNLIRFMPDRTMGGIVQKLGGWTKYYASSVGTIVRALWGWNDTNNNSYLAAGGETSLSIISNNNRQNITPQIITTNVPFYKATQTDYGASTTLSSSTVTVYDPAANVNQYYSINLETPISVGGLVLFGLYSPIGPYVEYSFNVTAKNVLGDPVYATSTVSHGGSAVLYTWSNDTATIKVTLSNHGFSTGNTYPAVVSTTVGGVPVLGNYSVTYIDANNFNITLATATSGTGSIYLNAPSGYGGTSTSSNTIGTGSKTFTVSDFTNNPTAGDRYRVYDSTDPSKWMEGIVTSYIGTSLIIDVDATGGAGTIASWIVIPYGRMRIQYQVGFGALPTGTGYGIGGYGEGGYGTGVAPTAQPGSTPIPITAVDWTLDNWGENLIATPYNNLIYEWSPTFGSPTATAIPNCPTVNAGAFVAMPQRQIVAWGSTFTGVGDPLLIRWCDVNDYTSWVGLPTNQAGSYRIPKGSRIVQCIQGPQQGLIWTDLGVWAMQYVGQPYVYQFNEIGVGCGLIGRKAAGSMNGVVYWMGQSQFFKLSGGGPEPIQCPIWDVIFQNLDRNNVDKIRIAPNSRFGEVAWFYPSHNGNGEPDSYVKYNVLLNQWDYGSLGRTAWINESVLGPPIGAAANQYIYQHETSPDADGQVMDSYLQTGYFALTEANVKMFVDQIWPDMKWQYYSGADHGASVYLTFYVTDYPTTAPTTYGPYLMSDGTDFITPRMRGRLVSIRLESTDLGTWWRLGNIRYRIQQDGKF